MSTSLTPRLARAPLGARGGPSLETRAKQEAAALYESLRRRQGTVESLRELIGVSERDEAELAVFLWLYAEEFLHVAEALELRRRALEEFNRLVAEGTAAPAFENHKVDVRSRASFGNHATG